MNNEISNFNYIFYFAGGYGSELSRFIWSGIKKYDAVGFKALNEKEQAIYTIWWLEAEVNNGGFHQYFWNPAGEHSDIALKSLKAIGAIKTAALLEKAIDIAFKGNLPENRLERQNKLDLEFERKMDQLNALDDQFYKYSEEFYKLIDVYVAK